MNLHQALIIVLDLAGEHINRMREEARPDKRTEQRRERAYAIVCDYLATLQQPPTITTDIAQVKARCQKHIMAVNPKTLGSAT